MSIKKHSILAVLLGLSGFLSAQTVVNTVPTHIDKKAQYVFYSHGKVLEGNIETPSNPSHPEWGVYQFPAVKQSLADKQYTLIAEHRGKDTNREAYAAKLAQDVQKLLSAGVPAKNISLVGFSRGGEITILTDNLLKNKDINVAILAACSDEMQNSPDIRLYGNILSIYEASDVMGSCQQLVQKSQSVKNFKEIKINTGEFHGAFFRPNQAWVQPLKKWLQRNQ